MFIKQDNLTICSATPETMKLTMDTLKVELSKMKMDYSHIAILQDKDGIIVARIMSENKRFILKFFQKREFCREIINYKALSYLNIPTLNIISSTDTALLMEDICENDKYRLGVEKDLDNPEIATLIAKWYQLLHRKGVDYVLQNSETLYDENDVITLENIEKIKRKTDTSSLLVWERIASHFDIIKECLKTAKRTLTYNDFYYTNLIVAKNHNSAMMYDYNLLGKGYAYADIRNVCSCLSAEAKEAFLDSYGTFDTSEKAIDDVASVLTTLYFACEKKHFPFWANDVLTELYTGYMDKVNLLLKAGASKFPTI